MRTLAILGSTGSVGRQCLQVVEELRERFTVLGLAAGDNVDGLAGQVARFQPEVVSVSGPEKVGPLRARLGELGVGREPEIAWGRDGLKAVATHPRANLVVSAAVGVVGLEATHQAIAAGKTVALANKEVLVAAGELVKEAARISGAEILPVDSEHNALHQCLRAGKPREVRRLVLTGSGGPFLTWPRTRLERVTPGQALKLFGLKPEQIDVVMHPQSTVHSMVEFVDGSVLAQMAPPDMRLPLQYALTYPDRLPSSNHRIDWAELRKLEFRPPPEKKFPCLRLAREALQAGGSMPCTLNAADEVAVGAFLERRLRFTQIPELVERVLEASTPVRLSSIEDVLDCDRKARTYAGHILKLLRKRKRKR
jgi:1-deoxy-D-xylulose-5-phosphate reductoisomerase